MKLHLKETLANLRKVLKTGRLARGAFVKEAEQKLQTIFDHKYVVLSSSGSGGMHATMLALGLKPEDEVITTSYTFPSPTNMILACGALPVFVDQTADFRINTTQIELAITSKTKGIVVVDLYGFVNDYAIIAAIAKKYGLWVISDSCQSLGATDSIGKYPIQYCNALIGSFFESKHIAIGEGGVVLARDQVLLDQINKYLSHGQPRGAQYQYEVIGLNYRPTDLQAAVLLPKLNDWQSDFSLRHKQAKTYRRQLHGVKKILSLSYRPTDIPTHYVIQMNPQIRERVSDELIKKGLFFSFSYPQAVHQYSLYQPKVKLAVDLTQASKFGLSTLLLPIGPNVTSKQLLATCEAIRHVVSKTE